MITYWILILILVAVIIFGVVYFGRDKFSRLERLKKKYYELSQLPPDEAERSLNFQLERLKEKHPDRDMEWYMDKIIFDLKKDKG